MGSVIFFLFIMAIVCAVIGSKRKVGAVGGFFLGLFLSVIGLLIVLSSKTLDAEAKDAALMQSLTQKQNITETSTADELQKLAALHASNAISTEEYENLKAKVING